MELKIDPDFEGFLPHVKMDADFVEDLVRNGIRDPIVTWNGFIIDGHRRYQVAQTNGLPFQTVSMDFATKDAVFKWMFNQQDWRRNWRSPHERSLALGRLHHKSDLPVAEIAESQGVSERTVYRAADYAEQHDNLTDEVKQVVANEKVSMSTVKELATLPPEKQREVVKKANENGLAAAMEEVKALAGAGGVLTREDNFVGVLSAMKNLKKALCRLGDACPGPEYAKLKSLLDDVETFICAWRDCD